MNDYMMMNALNLAFADWGSRKQAARNWEYQQKQAEMQFNYNMMFQKDAQQFAASQTDKQNQFALDMWNRSNEYNDPSAVAERYREAGYNPYMMNNSNIASTQSSTPSPAGAGQSSVGMPSGQISEMNITPISAVMQHLANANLSKYQSDLLSEEAKGKGIDNISRNLRNLTEIRALMQDTDNKQLLGQYQKIANMFVEDMYEQDYQNKLLTNHNLMLQGRSMGFTIAAQALQNSYLPEQLQLDIAMKNAELYSQYQKGNLTMSQYKYQLIQNLIADSTKDSKIEGDNSSNRHRKLDYNTAVRIANYLVEKAKNETMPNSLGGLPNAIYGIYNKFAD